MQESMQESNPNRDLSAAESSFAAVNRRLIALFIALLVLLLLVLLPPFLNVSRLQRRVARNIGASLGRPVHFDQITLNLLPIPGFTLQNFVVDENPAFGSEPILRASQVRANLRLGSLWSRHVEFSRISLTEPSVNLVLAADGQWNIGDLLLQACRTQAIAASTVQTSAVYAPHLPYIEASGARLNFKLDQEKTPFSLTDADFALWLPQPHQWRLRLEAHPVRTDTSPADTGTVRVEATLGPAGTSADSLANLPIALHGSWQDVQLGGLSRLLAARDAGLRGELALTVNLIGTLGQNNIAADIQFKQCPPRRLRSPASALCRGRLPHHRPQHLLHLHQYRVPLASLQLFRSQSPRPHRQPPRHSPTQLRLRRAHPPSPPRGHLPGLARRRHAPPPRWPHRPRDPRRKPRLESAEPTPARFKDSGCSIHSALFAEWG